MSKKNKIFILQWQNTISLLFEVGISKHIMSKKKKF